MITNIESTDNSKIKLVRKLANRKARDEENLIVIEGINLVREAMQRGIDIKFILVSDEYEKDDYLLRCIEKNAVEICQVPESIFGKIVDAENGIGIIAVIAKPSLDLSDAAVSKEGNVLVLDRVQDPGNIGTMIRTAVAAGYEMILTIKGTADMYSPKVLRSTAGMIFDIPIAQVQDAKELESLLKKLGKKIAVTTVDGGETYFKQNLKHGIALVIGNEGNGVSEEMLELADIKVTIPMHGEIESLNAAVSAAILMYETIRG